MIKIKTLKKAKLEDILRLSKWLKLNTDGMSLRQIIKLIKWRITRTGINRY